MVRRYFINSVENMRDLGGYSVENKKDIIIDYTLSKSYLKDILKKYEKNKEIKEIITPKTEYMEQFLNYFEKEYKTINSYLDKIGITEEEINKIKNKYLE